MLTEQELADIRAKAQAAKAVTDDIMCRQKETAVFIACADPTGVLALLDEIDRLRAENAKMREALAGVETDWNSLPEGNYSPKVIHAWLNGPMVEAIRRARAIRKETEG